MLIAMKMPISSTPPVLRRVRAADTQSGAWNRPDGLDYCLDRWKGWMQRDDTDLGMQLQKSLSGKGSYGDGDSEGEGDGYALTTKLDNEVGEATDAMIRGLKTSHQWAIKNKCSVATVWNFPQLDFIVEAQDACVELEKKLRDNKVTRAFF